MHAVFRGRAAVVRLLLRRGAHVSRCGWGLRQALHWAADRGQLACVEALLRAGADPLVEGITHAPFLPHCRMYVPLRRPRVHLLLAHTARHASEDGKKQAQHLMIACQMRGAVLPKPLLVPCRTRDRSWQPTRQTRTATTRWTLPGGAAIMPRSGR